MGGKPNNSPPPPPPAPPMQKGDPPPPPSHTRKNDTHVERKDCPHKKNTPIGETHPPPHRIFLFMFSPPPLRASTLPSPLRAPIMIIDPLTLFRLFERVRKKSTKIKQKQKISGS